MALHIRVEALALLLLLSMIVLSSPWRSAHAFQKHLVATTSRHHRSLASTSSTHLFSTASQSSHKETQAEGLWLPSHNHSSTPIRSIAAPMVAASDYAFRCLCRQHGVDLTFTQMLHAQKICADPSFRANHFDFAEVYQEDDMNRYFHSLPSQKQYLDGFDTPALEPSKSWHHDYRKGPVVVQLAGNDPEQVVEAAHRILEYSPGISGFDLNCGCPQGIAKKGNYGAFLAESDNAHTICTILEALRNNLPTEVAVSAKIRLPLNPQQLDDRITRLVNTGIDFLTIHGRTIKQNKYLVRESDTDMIRQAVAIAHRTRPNFPVVANGGVESLVHVDQVLHETNTVAIMSSEGLLETPQLFYRDTTQYSPRQRLEAQFQVTRDYLYWTSLYPPHPGVLGSDGGTFNVIRGHLFKFLHRYLQEHTDIRDRLAIPPWKQLVQAQEIVDELYSRYDGMSDEDLLLLESSQPISSWYRRHWSANAAADARTNIPARGDTLSIEERKRQAQERILKLRQQRMEKEEEEEQQANAPVKAVG